MKWPLLYHIRADASPLLLITGDREKELLGRYEENAYLWKMMQVVEHPDTTLLELEGFDHGQMAEPAFPLLLDFVDRISKVRRPRTRKEESGCLFGLKTDPLRSAVVQEFR